MDAPRRLQYAQCCRKGKIIKYVCTRLQSAHLSGGDENIEPLMAFYLTAALTKA